MAIQKQIDPDAIVKGNLKIILPLIGRSTTLKTKKETAKLSGSID